VEIIYDPAKNARNIRERGLSFDSAAEFDFDTALLEIDDRRDYGETRLVALGILETDCMRSAMSKPPPEPE
jgi:uncharacterized DUF497 family protein